MFSCQKVVYVAYIFYLYEGVIKSMINLQIKRDKGK